VRALAHLCRFSALDAIPPRSRRDPLVLLRVLAVAKRFSAFEVDDRLAGALWALQKGVFITCDIAGGYPWTKVELTEKGTAALEHGLLEAPVTRREEGVQ